MENQAEFTHVEQKLSVLSAIMLVYAKQLLCSSKNEGGIKLFIFNTSDGYSLI